MDERTITMPAQWANTANTTIPAPPVPGQAYRNTALSAETIATGQKYSQIADSAEWNQLHWLMSGLIREGEQYGVPRYSPYTDYPQHGICLGAEDGRLYAAVQPSGPNNGGAQPTSNSAYWSALLPPDALVVLDNVNIQDEILTGNILSNVWYYAAATCTGVPSQLYNQNVPSIFLVQDYPATATKFVRLYRPNTGEAFVTHYSSTALAWQPWQRIDWRGSYPTTTIQLSVTNGVSVTAPQTGWYSLSISSSSTSDIWVQMLNQTTSFRAMSAYTNGQAGLNPSITAAVPARQGDVLLPSWIPTVSPINAIFSCSYTPNGA